jgi:hypothetical protein
MASDYPGIFKIFFSSSLRLQPGLVLVVWLILLCGSGSAQRLILKDSATPIAEQPSPKSRVMVVLAKGDTVRILKINGGWAQVAFRGKQKGWMFVGRNAPPANTNPPAASAAVEASKPVEQTNLPAATMTEGGISFHLGSFSRQFTYVGKFYYRTLPALYVEGTFQYVAGDIASFYLMYGNAKYARALGQRLEGALTAGVGVINTVPVRAAGVKSVSNMTINYGFGMQRHLKNNNWLRLDFREHTAIRRSGFANFFEFTVGIAIGIRWSKL